jgi:hypothetical protein
MDPEELYLRLRRLADSLPMKSDNDDDFVMQVDELCYRFLELDEWLRKGGYLPPVWDVSADEG